MSTKIKIFHSGDFKGSAGLEEKVNSFCKGLEILKISTGVRSGITLAPGSQLVGTTYDIIIVYREDADDEAVGNSRKLGEHLGVLYHKIKAAMPGEPRNNAYNNYLKVIEKVVAMLPETINETEIASLFGVSRAVLRCRDDRISKLLGREVRSVRIAAANLGRHMIR